MACVLRVGLRAGPCFTQPAVLSRSHITRALAISKRNVAHFASAPHFTARIPVLRHAQRTLPLLLTATVVAGSALGISSLTSPSALHCDDVPSRATPSLPPTPEVSMEVYELAFGAVCGLFAGIFVKKSACMVAFFLLGELFIILQYLESVSLIKVDWARMASPFENLFYTTDVFGNKKPPTVRSMWKWIVDFLMADFRSSFVAGFTLRLEVG